MEKPNLIESVMPCSGQYSWRKDLHLNVWLFVAVAFYIATLLLNKHHPEWSPLSRALVALIPLVPGMFYVRRWLRFMRGMDELQQRIKLWAILVATAGTMVIEMVIDTLNVYGATVAVAPHGLGLGGAFLVLLCLWLLASGVIYRRYK